jgi:SAM-dependent MidA family methyltransferase
MNSLTAQIQQEIRRAGLISFARFMELALYAPGLGYYERQREIGSGGDFFTSVSVGSLFGELLAFQFARWWDDEAASGPLEIVEAGAHDGTLACDILDWFRLQRPELMTRLNYCLIESSAFHRKWQNEKLRDYLSTVRWTNHISELPSTPAHRIIFSNEFLDAMPVHRLAWSAAKKEWLEYFVTCAGEGFAWEVARPSLELPKTDPEIAAVLPDGFNIEFSPMAVAWWKQAAEKITRGKLLAVDYGLTNDEQFRPEREQGTLRAFSHHHLVKDPLAHPGECDLTAHVNFSAIEQAGHSAGLRTNAFLKQDKFLTEAAPSLFPSWNPARIKQFKTLTHPEHLGRSFRVLIQSRPAG